MHSMDFFKEEPTDHLLLHPIALNVSGVIGSAVALGILLCGPTVENFHHCYNNYTPGKHFAPLFFCNRVVLVGKIKV